MTPDDPRHGTYAGAVAHWTDGEPLCPPCWRAQDRYRKARKLELIRGGRRQLSNVGSLRRLQGLAWMGWSDADVAAASGLSLNTLRSQRYRGGEAIRRDTAAAIAAAFDGALGATRKPGRYGKRQHLRAVRLGYAPPFAWDDIDDPNETPTGRRTQTGPPASADTEPDVVHVDRLLGGEWSLAKGAPKAVRFEVIGRWVDAGHTTNELERLTGWNVSRDLRAMRAADAATSDDGEVAA